MNGRERATASPHLLACQVMTGFQSSQDLCDISRPAKTASSSLAICHTKISMSCTLKGAVSGTAAFTRSSVKPVRATPCRARTAVVVRASQDTAASRREALAAGSVVLAGLFSAAPAQAFLGFGEGEAREAAYKDETGAILGKVNTVLALDKDDPAKEDSVKALRKDINSWVAKYRRDEKFSGRPSYGNTYSALNALAGHYNSFGATAPIPKKRLERLTKELADAELLLTRGR